MAARKSKTGFVTAKASSSHGREIVPEILVPSSIFRDRNIAVLEALVEYLKNSRALTYHEIAVLLNRDDRTIWTCYSRAAKKRRGAK